MVSKLLDNQLLLPSGILITLNYQQVEAIDKIRVWLKSTEPMFVLEGFAGTGKSCSIKKLLDSEKLDVTVSAPTHKALKVISKFTGRAGRTLQALLGLSPNVNVDNFDINNLQFDPLGKEEISLYDLVIIDEASMINSSLYNYLEKVAKRTHVKIIFLGDKRQIPPVGEKISPVFSAEIPKYSLTKIERQNNGNPLLILNDQLRDSVEDLTDIAIETVLNEKGEGTDVLSLEGFKEKLDLEFNSENYVQDPLHSKMLTWTNVSVKQWNSIIRKMRFPEVATPLIVGDVLMSYANIGRTPMGESMIKNSEDYLVTYVEAFTSNFGVPGYIIGLKEIDSINVFQLFVVEPTLQGEWLYLKTHDKILQKALSYQPGKYRSKVFSQEYFPFKESHTLMRDCTTGSKKTKDIDYGYAVSIHKSQGSTYNTTFISEPNINKNRNIEERNKIKYVAYSRASHKAFVYQ